MSVVTTTNKITDDVTRFTPLVVGTVIAIQQQVALPGASKLDIATGIIMTAAQAAATVPVPSVQAIAGLVNLVVSIFKAFNLHGFKADPKPTIVPAPAA